MDAFGYLTPSYRGFAVTYLVMDNIECMYVCIYTVEILHMQMPTRKRMHAH